MNPVNYNYGIEKQLKYIMSDTYNYIFNMENGFFARWGKTRDDDPQFSPIGPELLDIEVSTQCHGGCVWCYKSNTPSGRIMKFYTFKKILDKIPRSVTQIAFGIGDLDSNPELWDMFRYCRKKKIVPNITINGSRLTDEMAEKLVKFCGAVAISHYDDEVCFNAVKLLTDKGLSQVNVHKLAASETETSCYALLNAVKTDARLKRLNAVILLGFKKKGKRNTYNPLRSHKFRLLVQYAINNRIHIGFDSCSANKFLEAVKNNPNYKRYKMMSEPCESTCFSMYINVDGITYPCSFLEGENGFKGINILSCKNFHKDIWLSPSFCEFRKNLIKINRNCPHFKI